MEDRNITDADRECPKQLDFNEKVKGTKDLKAMQPGDDLGKNWKVVRAINSEKGFNTIYVAEHKNKKKMAAIKVEKKSETIKQLQFELYVLLAVEKQNKCKQFCKVFEKGNEKDYNWIAITLCGKNLRALRKRQPGGKLTLACGLSVAQQCLKGLEELHRMGFIHRNVAPSVFAIGNYTGSNEEDLRNIYILDFGFAHQFQNKDGTLKPPSPNPWKYVGSRRHMPRAAHSVVEFSRMEDLEMWFYMSVELIKGCLPWAHLKKTKDVFDYQKSCRNGLQMRELLGGLPNELADIMQMIDKLSFTDTPKYSDICGILSNAILFSGKNELPYDWEETEIQEFKNPPKSVAEEKK
uniref:Protein kinase domain-containing protein n=1 Tax=Caenorhabditis japonica TaxID=281687 RepID=A0A8R1I1H8_CAEJA